MIHIVKLEEQEFNSIKSRTKKYEICLNDRNIKIGDFIEFQKTPFFNEKIIVTVEDIINYNNLNNEFIKKNSIEKQKEVIAIKLNKEIIINNSNINNISFNDEIFNPLRKNYDNFDFWFKKIRNDNIDIYYTNNNSKITSIMILKLNEKDSQQLFEQGKILKIRTFLVNDKKKGIGRIYLNIVDNLAIKEDVDYIYLTIKIYNNELINFMEKNGYKKYNQYNDEFVYYKKLK